MQGVKGDQGLQGLQGLQGATGATGPSGSVGFNYQNGYLPSAVDGVIYSDSQFQLLYVPSREALAYTVAGTWFYGSTVVKSLTRKRHISYLAVLLANQGLFFAGSDQLRLKIYMGARTGRLTISRLKIVSI